MGIATVLVIVGCAVALVMSRAPEAPPPAAEPDCGTVLQVVTAASFAPVLSAIAPDLTIGDGCSRLQISVADGRVAVARMAEVSADVWIPDDSAWAGIVDPELLAKPNIGGAGQVVATSPVYFVADRQTADRVTAAGGSWLGLAELVTGGSGVRMVVRDPAGSGDGLVAAGALGEAVWVKSGMNASSEALARAVPATRTVQDAVPAFPAAPGEVGLVPEYALVGQGDATADDHVVLAPTDHTALLRYTWLPTAAASTDPTVATAMGRLLQTLVGPQASEPIAAAGLRRTEGDPPDAVRSGPLPPASAAPFEVLGRHHVEHVFATFYAADRKSELLVVVDVSGSMADPPPGSDIPLIELVRQGCNRLGELLPDESVLSLWEFGSQLNPPRDYRELLPRANMTAEHRHALASATGALAAQKTGTGLYDTLLAAYTEAKAHYRPGRPNHVVLFTDGRNEYDPGSISREQLMQALQTAQDAQRPIQLTVLTFGPESDVKLLGETLKPIGGYVDQLRNADDVRAAFIHVAAGGLHG